MHTNQSSQPPGSGTSEAEVSLSTASHSSAEQLEPKFFLWQRVEAFRELLQHGGSLLGEVSTLSRNAELSAAALEERQATIDGLQRDLEGRTHELSELQDKHRLLQAEFTRLRQAPPPILQTQKPVNTELERRVKSLEAELAQTRATLLSERERRNRAISLIKPMHHEKVDTDGVGLGSKERTRA